MKISPSPFLVTVCMVLVVRYSKGLEISRQFMAIPHGVQKIWQETMEHIKHFTEHEKKEYLQAEDGPMDKILKALGLKHDPEQPGQPGEVKNWMHISLHTPVTYGTGKEAQTFNVLIDSAYNMIGGMPANFMLDNCPKIAIDDKGTLPTCARHNLEIYAPKSSTSLYGDHYITIKAIEGTQFGVRIASDTITFTGHPPVKGLKFLLLDGANFALFDAMQDSGAPGTPKMEGVFSLAPGSMEFSHHKITSGMAQMVAHDEHKIATVYMEEFFDLDFYSKNKCVISIGKLDQENCKFGAHPKWMPIVEQESAIKRWKIGMDVHIQFPQHSGTGDEKEESEQLMMKDQQVLISTMDTFIFAPKSVTDRLMAPLKIVGDNWAFHKIKRTPKEVLIHCPSAEVMATLPTIDFIFGTQKFSFEPKDYILPLKFPLNTKQDTHKVGVFNWCHIMIRARPDPSMFAHFVLPDANTDQWMFGQMFFNKACVAFNYEHDGYKVALAEPVGENGGDGQHEGGH